jgi:hypothetical protein
MSHMYQRCLGDLRELLWSAYRRSHAIFELLQAQVAFRLLTTKYPTHDFPFHLIHKLSYEPAKI